ncbi:Sir2 histone deacetylase Hst2 [Clarireedia jacksonii]
MSTPLVAQLNQRFCFISAYGARFDNSTSKSTVGKLRVSLHSTIIEARLLLFTTKVDVTDLAIKANPSSQKRDKRNKMGQEASHQQIDPNEPPRVLSSRSIDGIAKFIKDGKAKKIVVMTGAGISTSAGIPDFRSPDTGIYANLAELDLPYPEAVFDIEFFRENPGPFYVLAKELYPGKFYPTVSHAFLTLLQRKHLLLKLFTQNIDCLERRAGVIPENIVEAHGSFATQRCIECKTDYPGDLMKKAVEDGDPATCLVPQCGGLVKPDIVFFGEQLPKEFHMNTHVPRQGDLVIVMGTSLSVQPFASLPTMVNEGVPRLLFNMESVGDFGCRLDDVIIKGDCDSGVRKLADALGWRDELEELWRSVGGDNKEKEAERLQEARRNMSPDEILEADIKSLTNQIDDTVKLSDTHTKKVNAVLEKDGNYKPPFGTSPSHEKELEVSSKSAMSGVPPDRSSLFKDLANFNKEQLSSTTTRVTTLDGQEFIEKPAGQQEVATDATMPQNMPNGSIEPSPTDE